MAPKDTPRPSSDPPSVLVVGAASRDLAADDPRGWRLGGAATYCSLTLARLGLPTRAVVGVDRDAARAVELDLLRAAGVELRLVDLDHGPVFDNVETPAGRVQECISASDPIPVTALPQEWSTSDGILFGSVAAEIPDGWADVIPQPARVGVAWQGFLRRLVAGERVEKLAPGRSAVLGRADLVSLGVNDLAPSTAITALLEPLAPGASLVLTNGPAGGLVARRGPTGLRIHRYPAIEAASIVDPTGAGDVFLATLFGAWLLGGPGASLTGDALRLAAAAGSLVVEAPGLAGVPEREAIRARAARAPTR